MAVIENLVHRIFLAYTGKDAAVPRIAPHRPAGRLVRSPFFGCAMEIAATTCKACPFDCVYCPHGKTTRLSIDRFDDCVSLDSLRPEIAGLSRKSPAPDFIVFGGTGDPTLNKSLPALINLAKSLTNIPVAVHTSGGLLWRHDVQHDLQGADVVLASFDAADKATFQTMNRPSALVPFGRFCTGVAEFSRLFKGRFWIHVTLTTNINSSDDHCGKLAQRLRKIRADKIFLQSGANRRLQGGAPRPSAPDLRFLAARLGDKAILADCAPAPASREHLSPATDILRGFSVGAQPVFFGKEEFPAGSRRSTAAA
jgi:wyosine [tRNA(Phe)-imidazoG37] synthetase (radical SAM superfamily)